MDSDRTLNFDEVQAALSYLSDLTKNQLVQMYIHINGDKIYKKIMSREAPEDPMYLTKNRLRLILIKGAEREIASLDPSEEAVDGLARLHISDSKLGSTPNAARRWEPPRNQRRSEPPTNQRRSEPPTNQRFVDFLQYREQPDA